MSSQSHTPNLNIEKIDGSFLLGPGSILFATRRFTIGTNIESNIGYNIGSNIGTNIGFNIGTNIGFNIGSKSESASGL